jgi:biotin carboxylase
VDATQPAAAPPELGFPFFVKPVKGAFSVLARRIERPEELRALLESDAVKEFTRGYMRIFNRLVAGLTDFACDGRFFLAEELLSGRLVTLEGFVAEGAVEILGIVDSGLDPTTQSFVRFDYPSALPGAVQARMADVARRVVRALGLDWTLFNIELVWDEVTDAVSIVEVNPRICGQFGDLYQKVDGTSSYEVLLSLALGRRPRIARGAGPFAAAASFPLRVFRPCTVAASPGEAAVAEAEADFPGALIWNECAAGEVLTDFAADEDGSSHRYAVVNLGGASRAELSRRLVRVRERLRWRMADAPEDEPEARS